MKDVLLSARGLCKQFPGGAGKEQVLNLLTGLADDGQSILMVTHDVRAAIRGTRVLYLEDGKILDEMEMGVYREADAKDREKKLNDWLSALSW